MNMLEKSTWDEFRAAGLLWWVNRVLHLFGWAIAVNIDPDGKVADVFPARCKFRGFDANSETEGFRQLTAHIASNTERLLDDAGARMETKVTTEGEWVLGLEYDRQAGYCTYVNKRAHMWCRRKLGHAGEHALSRDDE